MADDFARLADVVTRAIEQGVVPGAVVFVADQLETRLLAAFGNAEIAPVAVPARPETVYDVASVTKAAVTSVLAMQAIGRGLVGLDDTVVRHFPEFHADAASARDTVTIRHLLSHASGLPAHRPFYERAWGHASARDEILRAACAEPLVGAPGAQSVYTDLGFMLLGWILERRLGARLDRAAARFITEPLGLASTMFVDLEDAAASRFAPGYAPPPRPGLTFAATERCAVRGRLLRGEVHDLNAFAMGGVAGHAGLFSTAEDLGRLGVALASAFATDAPGNLVDTRVLRELWRPAGVPGSTWRLGWDGPAEHGSQAGALLSRAAVGHLGFTGCSLWIDPARGRVIVLLSNRVHPTVRDDPRFRVFRPAVHDAIVDALDGLVGS